MARDFVASHVDDVLGSSGGLILIGMIIMSLSIISTVIFACGDGDGDGNGDDIFISSRKKRRASGTASASASSAAAGAAGAASMVTTSVFAASMTAAPATGGC